MRGQCLLLVRPDHYVGFRCEPVRERAVLRYFTDIVGMNPAALTAPVIAAMPPCRKGAPTVDPAPIVLAGLLSLSVAALIYGAQLTTVASLIVIACCLAMIALIVRSSLPPRD